MLESVGVENQNYQLRNISALISRLGVYLNFIATPYDNTAGESEQKRSRTGEMSKTDHRELMETVRKGRNLVIGEISIY